MLSKILINTFIKNKDSISDKNVRSSYVVLGGLVGVIINSLLFIIKLSVGLLASSVAVMADAFNNLSDAFSSIVTIVGIKIADKPADSDHPFGHGRIEYISALIVSFFVMIVGLQFIKTSFEKILNPTQTNFETIPFILLLISIAFKFWLSRFNKLIGFKINSSALKAASVDALGDVFTSSCVAISFFMSKFTSFPIDGYFGLAVAIFIIYSGFTLIKETLNPILGEAPDKELVKSIKEMALSYDHILGIHDLMVHNYGPRKWIASFHAEVPSNISIMLIHEIIDTAEKEIARKLDIELVIHMDPICISNIEVNEAHNEVDTIIKNIPSIKSFHDFRIIGENDNKNLVFDVVVNRNYMKNNFDPTSLKDTIIKEVKKLHPNYDCVITIDFDYI